MTAAVLTISDRCSRGAARDTSGPALERMLTERLAAQITARACVPDEIREISAHLSNWATQSPRPDLILTTGGTGLGPRDVTPEATDAVLERRHPALLELARLRCLAHTPLAYLSRGSAGTCGQSLIINLPGSKRGCTQVLEALLDILPHAVAMLRGEDHPSGSLSTGGGGTQ
jgi:molybdopterin adenylyltransferase